MVLPIVEAGRGDLPNALYWRNVSELAGYGRETGRVDVGQCAAGKGVRRDVGYDRAQVQGLLSLEDDRNNAFVGVHACELLHESYSINERSLQSAREGRSEGTGFLNA
jgi:hypothetical protein